jgi:N-acetylneuraminic acid mutarotase
VIGSKFIVAGGFNYSGVGMKPEDTLSSAEQYDPVTNKWTAVAPMTNIISSAVGAALGGKFIVAGGDNLWRKVDGASARTLSSAMLYNPVTSKWTTVASMNTMRQAAVGAVLGGKLIVAGGFTTSVVGYFTFSSAEQYDPVTNKWTALASMTTGRCYAAGAVLEGKFIVAGGNNYQDWRNGIDTKLGLASAEQYDPTTNKWTAIASMNERRRMLCGAVLEGKFIVAGGVNYPTSSFQGGKLMSADSSQTLASAERYDPVTNKWATIASMNTARRNAVGAALGGKFIVAGGTDEFEPSIASAEQYDPTTNKWTAIASMNERRRYATAAVYFVDCPAGTFIGDTGCFDCQPGTFQAETRQPTCTKCPSSRYHTLKRQTNVSSCKPCPAGKFGSPPGLISCVACKVGQHQQHAAQSSCINCRSGRFQNRTGQPTCDQCRDGQFAAVDGRTDCGTCEGLQGCSVGEFDTCGTSISKFASGGICLSCPPGNSIAYQ